MRTFILLSLLLAIAFPMIATAVPLEPQVSGWIPFRCRENNPHVQSKHRAQFGQLTHDPDVYYWDQDLVYMVYSEAAGTYVDMIETRYWQMNYYVEQACGFRYVQAFPRGPGVWAFQEVDNEFHFPILQNHPLYDVHWVTPPLGQDPDLRNTTMNTIGINGNSAITYISDENGNSFFDELLVNLIPHEKRYYSGNIYSGDQWPLWTYLLSHAVLPPADVKWCNEQYLAGNVGLHPDPFAVDGREVYLCTYTE